MHISIVIVQKIPKKLLSKCPPEFGFFSPGAYAVPGVRGTPLPLVHSASPGRHILEMLLKTDERKSYTTEKCQAKTSDALIGVVG